MFSIFYQIYYGIKTYINSWFKKTNSEPIMIKEKSENDLCEISNLKKKINFLESNIDINKIYSDLETLDKSFSKQSNLNEIIYFLENEEKFISKNADNLSISMENIKKNTYIINLKRDFINLREITIMKNRLKDLSR